MGKLTREQRFVNGCIRALTTKRGEKKTEAKIAIDAGYSARSAHVTACRLLKKAKIRIQIEKAQQEIAERNAVTADSLIAELDEVRDLAITVDPPQLGAAVQAIKAKGKIVGLVKDKVEHIGENGKAIEVNVKHGGLNDETAEFVRRKVLGLEK